jgi:hypothetical protein
VNLTTIQPFVNYNLDDGWFISSVPIITANWEASSGNEWTVPVGVGVGKALTFGTVPEQWRFMLTTMWKSRMIMEKSGSCVYRCSFFSQETKQA